MRRIRTTSAAAMIAVAALALSACGHDPSSPDTTAKSLAVSPVAAIQKASVATAQSGSASFTMAMTMTVGGQSVAFSGKGAFDYKRSVGRMSLSLPESLGVAAGPIDEIVTPDAVYLSGALFGKKGKWVKVDISKLGATAFSSGLDPAKAADMLKSVAAVTRVGSERIKGVATTHYKGTLDTAKAYAAMAPSLRDLATKSGVTLPKSIPFDAWIDGRGRLAQLTEQLTLPVQGQSVGMRVQMNLGDYGKPVVVAVPRAADLVTVPGVSALGS